MDFLMGSMLRTTLILKKRSSSIFKDSPVISINSISNVLYIEVINGIPWIIMILMIVTVIIIV
ncbi:hypothetical protein AB8U03_09520 [Clostridium sp. Mt-5]|uniref:Uncharacterized protein n=2 Tax=Clostridium moutaii TaxID=3240932 RepID=A0ABV4BNS2_9CLOT